MSVHPRRIRLKPWLLSQVDSGRYPGLQWLSHDHRLFQIPWKHATRHTPLCDEESTIFKAWALETGKFQEGVDEPDPAKWKANLRCALNKSREFQLKYDGTKETPVQPYKIYEVCEQHSSADGAEDEEEEMPNLMDLTLNPRISDAPSLGPFPRPEANPFPRPEGNPFPRPEANPFPQAEANPFPQSEANPFPRPEANFPLSRFGPHVIPVPLLPDTVLPASDLQAAGPMVDRGTFVHPGVHNGLQGVTPLPPPAPPAHPGLEAMEASGPEDERAADQSHRAEYDLLSSVPLTDLDLKFQYRGKTTGSLTVSNPQGCRLYYGNLEPTPDQVDLFGPVNLQQVLFPGTAEIQNQKQQFYTDALLDVMDRGLILEMWEQDIYAVRLCQCKVFWSGPGMPHQGPPNPMEREKKIRVFSLNDFLQGLILFQKGEAPNPPPFEIYFCFGEDWPDKKPKEKKLIIVQVVPVVARILTEMFSGELSWSTDSIRLQISKPDVKDQTVAQFKELQKLLQSQNIQGPWNPVH